MESLEKVRCVLLVLLAVGQLGSSAAQQPDEATIPDPPYPSTPLTICADGKMFVWVSALARSYYEFVTKV